MNKVIIIIFGATGDLAKRKLFPSLYRLLVRKKIENVHIVGVACDVLSAREVLDRVYPFIDHLDTTVWNDLCHRFSYQQLDFDKREDFVKLKDLVEKVERGHPANRLIYLAAAAHYFCAITEHVAAAGLARKIEGSDTPWHRIVYEKPFGHNCASAHLINQCIARFFHEDQIYRIDHYLTKELVSNIALIRFTNCIFEPLWNNRYIDHVQISLSENMRIETRGSYYDKYGALKDVVQNHIMSLVALIGMESPAQLTGESVAIERARVLEKVIFVDGILGQYKGYKQEKEVAPQSKTETFTLLHLQIDNNRWAGVPFFIKTGKCLNKKETIIHIKFKHIDCLLTKECPTMSNYLTIQIAPDATFALSLNAKKVGEQSVMPIKMEFCHSCLFADQTPQAYEILLEEVMKGERSVSVRFDEIEHAWKLIDMIEALNLPLYEYEQGSIGPQEAEDFAKKYNMRWRS